MPDANLFKQTHLGITFWSGVFETHPVVLLLMAGVVTDKVEFLPHRYVLYDVLGTGALSEVCEFKNGEGRCKLSGRTISLLIHSGAQTAYISTINKNKDTFNPFAKGTMDDFFSHMAAGRVRVGVDVGGGDKSVHGNVYIGGKTYPIPSEPFKKHPPRKLDPLLDCFAFLGLTNSPTEIEIKTAFRDKIKVQHPDIQGGSEEMSRNLIIAYDEALRRMGYRAS